MHGTSVVNSMHAGHKRMKIIQFSLHNRKTDKILQFDSIQVDSQIKTRLLTFR